MEAREVLEDLRVSPIAGHLAIIESALQREYDEGQENADCDDSYSSGYDDGYQEGAREKERDMSSEADERYEAGIEEGRRLQSAGE